MPKYCPICVSEFSDVIAQCPRDNATLVTQKPATYEQYFDIYAASNEIEAERIITFLREEGIDANESVTGISQIPSAGDTHFIICVKNGQRFNARKLLERAREDGVISLAGAFL